MIDKLIYNKLSSIYKERRCHVTRVVEACLHIYSYRICVCAHACVYIVFIVCNIIPISLYIHVWEYTLMVTSMWLRHVVSNVSHVVFGYRRTLDIVKKTNPSKYFSGNIKIIYSIDDWTPCAKIKRNWITISDELPAYYHVVRLWDLTRSSVKLISGDLVTLKVK